MRMKKILLGVTLVLLGFSMNAGTTNTPAPTPSGSTDTEYCPKGYICVATNMTASTRGQNSHFIYGISIYEQNGNKIAYVPKHGHLRLTWDPNYHRTGVGAWWFYANGESYYVLNYK